MKTRNFSILATTTIRFNLENNKKYGRTSAPVAHKPLGRFRYVSDSRLFRIAFAYKQGFIKTCNKIGYLNRSIRSMFVITSVNHKRRARIQARGTDDQSQ